MPAVSPYFGVAGLETALAQSALILAGYALACWLIIQGIRKL